MRLRNATFALLLGATPLAASAQMMPVRRMTSKPAERAAPKTTPTQGKDGTLKGVVSGSDDLPGDWTIIVESENSNGEHLKRFIDTEGRFEVNLPPGVYTARVKTAVSGGRKKHIPYSQFLVQPGEVTHIKVDPTYERVLCNSANDPVLPIISSAGERESRRGLHRPHYEVRYKKHSENVSLRMVIQYCERTSVGRLYRYKSATFNYDTVSMSATVLMFDPLKFELSGLNVNATQDGTDYEAPRVTASLGDGKDFLNLVAGQVSSLKGSGELDSGAATFNFKIGGDGDARFRFEDRATGLKLNSRKNDSMVIMASSDEGVTFRGSASVDDYPDAPRGSIVRYTVTLNGGRKNKSKDQFVTVHIPSKNYKLSGRLTSGNIAINPASQQTSSYSQ